MVRFLPLVKRFPSANREMTTHANLYVYFRAQTKFCVSLFADYRARRCLRNWVPQIISPRNTNVLFSGAIAVTKPCCVNCHCNGPDLVLGPQLVEMRQLGKVCDL
jgi:hypothetical protein